MILIDFTNILVWRQYNFPVIIKGTQMINFKGAITAVSMVFIFNGTLLGAWASRIPAIMQTLEISQQELSVLLFLLAAGAISSFPVAGKLSDSIGASELSAITFWLYGSPFIFIGFSANIIMLGISIFIFGCIHGAMDVAMNSWASEVEAQKGKTIMPFFHAMFSLGAGIGAASGAIMSWLDVTPALHFTSLVLLLIPGYWWVRKGLSSSPKKAIKNTVTKKFILPKGRLLVVALIAFSCALGEGAMVDWTAVYMSQEINSSHSEAALAYTIFSIFMVLTRLSGSSLIDRFGAVNMVKWCALSSFIGAIIVVTANAVFISYLGFALLGIGYSIVMPLAFSKAASVDKVNKGNAIAGIATFAYGGMLLGPVLLGMMAEVFSLRVSFTLFIFLSIYVFITAKSLDDKLNRSNKVNTCNQ